MHASYEQQWPDVVRAVQSYGRFSERCDQAAQFNKWSLSRRVPDPDSSLAVDDRVLDELLGVELGDPLIASGSAVFPAMVAVDNINAVNKLRDSQGGGKIRLWTPSTLNLCRSALESASRTIWLLSPTDRTSRRVRTLGLIGKEWYEQGQYFKIANPRSARDRSARERHREYSESRRAVVEELTRGLKDDNGFKKYGSLIKYAAEWIDANPPAHRKDELRRRGITATAEGMYSLESSTVHGFKWAHELLSDSGDNLIGVIADAIYSALVATECAVSLFEAQSIGSTDRAEPIYPKYLRQSVKRLSRRYR